MKQLQKSDLKVGKVYRLKAHNKEYLYRISGMRTSMTLCNDGFLIININKFNKISNISQSRNFADAKYIETNQKYEFYNATPKEKHWLETCIKADKFISYEEAMKSFIPEYVECIEKSVFDYGTNVIGKIYKVFEVTPNHINTDYLIEYGGIKHLSVSKHRFKPSTKEAYDAQFVVKEPEFVLPEKWCINIELKPIEVLNYFDKGNNSTLYRKFNDWYTYLEFKGKFNGDHIRKYKPESQEITLEQFKKYVLKENTKVTEKPKVVLELEEPKDKVLTLSSNYGKESIVKVECSEGGVYRIGDKITVFDKYSPNKGKVFTIKSFRWSNDKSKICAVTELHTPNGIGLDKIELYVEPKVKQELSLLEQAKLRYPIGTKFKVACQPHLICTVLNHDTYHFQTSEICNLYVEEQNYGVNGATVYYKSKWAEIIDDFVLPENWCVEVNEELRNRFGYFEAYGYHHSIQINDTNKWSINIKEGFTEITFEKFKKYVLKDE